MLKPSAYVAMSRWEQPSGKRRSRSSFLYSLHDFRPQHNLSELAVRTSFLHHRPLSLVAVGMPKDPAGGVGVS